MSKRHAALAAAALALIAAAAAGIARATIPDAGGTIHACFKSQNGQLRVVDAASLCQKSEQPVAWVQMGSTGGQGPQGPQGIQGQQGPQGDQGSSGRGVSGYQLVTATGTTATQGGTTSGSAFAVCPGLTTLVGGGFQLPPSADVTVERNEGSYSILGTQWEVEVWGQAGVTFTAYAVCVDSQPLSGS